MKEKKMSNWLNTKSFNTRDEYYTPKVLVEPIIKYVKPEWIVWCPFDTENSEFVHALKSNGNEVINTHLGTGHDFFEYEPENYDVIISNPPFSKKLEVFERLYKLDKPFAMILGIPILNYQNISSFFIEHKLQLLIPNKKVSFDGNQSSFSSGYFCYNMLPNDLMFCDVRHNNSNKNFEESRMHKDLTIFEDRTGFEESKENNDW